MNKQDAIARLNAIEKEQAELRRIIEGPGVVGLWRPKSREMYWIYSTQCNSVIDKQFVPLAGWDEDRFDFGNCFPTRQAAEKAAPLMARANKIIAAALQADPDAGIQDKDERVWTVQFDEDEGFTPYSDWGTTSILALPHVHTEAQAEHMAAILNAEGIR